MSRGYIGNPSPACCCVGGGCLCECANCETVDNQDEAPCCWFVTIAGIVDNGCAGDCLKLNVLFRLTQDGTEPDEECTWSFDGVCGNCDPDTITLEILHETGYVIRVTLGDHVWEKTYVDKPSCCRIIGQALDFVSTGGNCDSTSATCVISRGLGDDPANCQNPACVFTCPDCCIDNEVPEAYLVEISGVADKTPDECSGGDCTTWNGTFILVNTPGNGCGFLVENTGIDDCWCFEETLLLIIFRVFPALVECRLVIGILCGSVDPLPCSSPTFTLTGFSINDPHPCTEADELDIPVTVSGAKCCDMSGATCTITALAAAP